MPSTVAHSASTAERQEWDRNVCVLTYDPLDASAITQSVGDDGVGATVVFIGTTRNSFKGGRDPDTGGVRDIH